MKVRSVFSNSTSLTVLTLICFLISCTSSGRTRLCANFESYQTIEAIRAELSRRGLAQGWNEKSQGTSPNDQRPPYRITYLNGPFRLSGVDGQLRFTFYNGQLMETQFSPQKGRDYMETLRRENSKVPQKPGEEIVTDRRTRFRFDVVSGGNLSFTWYDPKLENQWKQWVASNS